MLADASVAHTSCQVLRTPNKTKMPCACMQIGSTFRGTFDFEASEFDWGDVKPPGHAMKDLIIYEVPVRTFTASQSSGVSEDKRGSYLGFAEKAAHLKDLGINAVELLPVFEFDELEFQRDKNKRDHMTNIWGYSHITFMAPMSRFAAGGGGPVAAAREFKQMVKAYAALLMPACLLVA